MRLLGGRHRRASYFPTELEVSAGRTLSVQGELVRQFVALMHGHAIAIVGGSIHHSLSPISIVGWPEVVNADHAPATVVTTSRARLLVLTPVECVDSFGANASTETVLATLRELTPQPF
jgi:hypothetical protein